MAGGENAGSIEMGDAGAEVGEGLYPVDGETRESANTGDVAEGAGGQLGVGDGAVRDVSSSDERRRDDTAAVEMGNTRPQCGDGQRAAVVDGLATTDGETGERSHSGDA